MNKGSFKTKHSTAVVPNDRLHIFINIYRAFSGFTHFRFPLLSPTDDSSPAPLFHLTRRFPIFWLSHHVITWILGIILLIYRNPLNLAPNLSFGCPFFLPIIRLEFRVGRRSLLCRSTLRRLLSLPLYLSLFSFCSFSSSAPLLLYVLFRVRMIAIIQMNGWGRQLHRRRCSEEQGRVQADNAMQH